VYLFLNKWDLRRNQIVNDKVRNLNNTFSRVFTTSAKNDGDGSKEARFNLILSDLLQTVNHQQAVSRPELTEPSPRQQLASVVEIAEDDDDDSSPNLGSVSSTQIEAETHGCASTFEDVPLTPPPSSDAPEDKPVVTSKIIEGRSSSHTSSGAKRTLGLSNCDSGSVCLGTAIGGVMLAVAAFAVYWIYGVGILGKLFGS